MPTPSKVVHAVSKHYTRESSCGVVLPASSTSNSAHVTCKRCLACLRGRVRNMSIPPERGIRNDV